MIKKISIAIILVGVLAWGIVTVWPGHGPTKSNLNMKPTAKGFIKEGEISFLDVEGKILAKVDVEIASRPEERDQGLMYRNNMPQNFGMLFMFEQSAPRSFWMRNTPISLDLVFLDERKKIVSIKTNTTPYTDDSIPSDFPAKYVIEVNAGFCAKNGILVGQMVLF